MMKLVLIIRKFLKRAFDLLKNETLKKNLLNALPYWVGAFLTGAIAIVYAKLFSWSELASHQMWLNSKMSFLFITPICFLVGWWLVVKYSPYSRGSGIPQVTASIELSNPKHNYKVNSLLSLRVVFIKILSSLFVVFGGGIIGREGPTIQISASIFKKINDLLPEWYPKISKRNMIVTGAAAGLAAAFNTPLGGIVFAIEEITKTHFSYFKSALLTGVIISGLTALYFLGPYLYLGYPQLGSTSWWVIFLILLISVVTGLAGSGMGALILWVFKIKKLLNNNFQRALYVLISGLIIASIALFVDHKILGSGKEIIVNLLFTNEKSIAWYTPYLRILGSILTFTTGAAGGIFAPSLAAGAGIGAVIGEWFQLTGTDINILLLSGMTGFLTSVTRSPFTSSILVLEMTNSHNVIFYIMLTALVANLVATIISRHSFYDQLKNQYIKEIHEVEEQATINVRTN
jgi:H+/Cl- antiporter ClcA